MESKIKINYGLFLESLSEYISKNYENKKQMRGLIKEFINIVSKNEFLKETHVLYNYMEMCKDVNKFKHIVNESDVFLKRQTPNTIKKVDSLLKEFLNKYKIDLLVNCEKQPLFESIDVILKQNDKPTYKIKREKAINLIESIIQSRIEGCKTNESEIDVENTLSLNDELFENLTDEEKKILESAIKEGDEESRKLLFDKLKKDCLEKVNNDIKSNTDDVTIKEKLLDVKEVLLELNYSEDMFVENVLKLYELKN
jgi:hypothetical protein